MYIIVANANELAQQIGRTVYRQQKKKKKKVENIIEYPVILPGVRRSPANQLNSVTANVVSGQVFVNPGFVVSKILQNVAVQKCMKINK